MRRVLLLCLAVLCLAPPARAQTLTMAGDEWCPYVCGQDPAKPGILVEIARNAFGGAGIAFDYKTMPWARALKDTRDGKYTAVLGALHENASDLIFPQTPQAQAVVTFYVRRGSAWRYYSNSDLVRVSLGTIADYAYDPRLDEYILRNQRDMKRIQPVAGEAALASNVKKLMIGRIDATVEMAPVMEYHLASQNLRKEIVSAGRMPDAQNIFIAFSPKNKNAQHYAALIASATEDMVVSGEMNTLFARYNIVPAAPERAP